MRHPQVFAPLLAALAGGPDGAHLGALRAPRGERSAAVLMLFTDEPDPALTFVTRAETLRHHAGQVALPGGAVDADDIDVVHTALREAEEEIGLPPAAVTTIGCLPALWVPKSRFDVTTVLGVWDGAHDLRPMDPAETGAVHRYRVSELASAETRRMSRHPSGFSGPAFELGGDFIWGMTALLVDWVLELGGWALPWNRVDEVPIPERFLND